MRKRWLSYMVVSVLVLGNVAAAQDNPPSIRGYVFKDDNRNGIFDAGEQGIPGVLVTVSHGGEYEHTYYTGDGDPNGSQPGPGSYGPTPLQSGYWKVTLNVPDAYRSTTPTELFVLVPEEGVATGVNFGLSGSGPIMYSSGTGVGMGGGNGTLVLPDTGGELAGSTAQWIALVAALIGLLTLIGTPWCVTQARRAHQRWW